jgi:hypothetical protein
MDRPNSTLLVETLKLERMGGKYVDTRLAYVNCQLHEVKTDDQPLTTYEETDAY